MSTNPNNAVGTNAAYGGRTSVKAFNDVLGVFDGRGILSGWAVTPSSGMTVSVGGNGTTRDVAIAENNTGDRTTINNISEQPVAVSIPEAPVSNSRYDLIVAYVNNPPTGSSAVADNPSVAGIIVVSGTVASSPTLPDESTIRDAITVDGGTGATAYYVVLASVLVATGTTDITSNLIAAGQRAAIGTDQIANNAVTSDKIDWTTIGSLAKMSVQTGTITVPSVRSGIRTNAVVPFNTPFKAGTTPVVIIMPSAASDANSARMIVGAPTNVNNEQFHYWLWNTTGTDFTNGKFVYIAFGEL